ncbi:hypothetical protein RYH73_06235 [Olivibacter sp. CPCC 100613]|uniref:hypothetical protein n=1 Tax=Olivibacter sp. CPCC 100613 TaxID=3079931 RepID=UPI002FFA584D
MKNLHLLTLIFFALFFSCGKDKNRPESLGGKWELRHILGVQIKDAPSDFEKGNGNVIEFSANEYQRIENGTLVSKGTYAIVEESAEIDGTQYEHKIVFDDSDQKVFIKISGNQLLICLGPIASDGTTITYEKI